MIKKFIFCIILGGCVIGAALPSNAGILKKGFGGALSGAALGSMLDGQEGARKGAAIGATVGVLGGAAEESKKKAQEEAQKRQEEERQRAIQEQQQREIEQLKAQQAQETAKANESAEASTMVILEIQKSLVRMGYDPGDVNGKISPATENAIRLYEAKYGLLETGRPSPELQKHMLRNGG